MHGRGAVPSRTAAVMLERDPFIPSALSLKNGERVRRGGKRCVHLLSKFSVTAIFLLGQLNDTYMALTRKAQCVINSEMV